MFIGSRSRFKGSRLDRIKHDSDQLRDYPDRIRRWKGSNRLLVSVLLGLYPFHYVNDPQLAYDVDWYKSNFRLPIEIEFSEDHILIYNKYNLYAPDRDPLFDPRELHFPDSLNLINNGFQVQYSNKFLYSLSGDLSLYDPSFPATPLSNPFFPLLFSGFDPAFKILNSSGDLYLIGDRYLYHLSPFLLKIFGEIENQVEGGSLELIQLG